MAYAVPGFGTKFEIYAPLSRSNDGSGGSGVTTGTSGMPGVGHVRELETQLQSVSRQISVKDTLLSQVERRRYTAQYEANEATQRIAMADANLLLLNTEFAETQTRLSRAPSTTLDAALAPVYASIESEQSQKDNASTILNGANVMIGALDTQRDALQTDRDALEIQRTGLSTTLSAPRIPAPGTYVWQIVPDITDIPTLPDQTPEFDEWNTYDGAGAPSIQPTGRMEAAEFEITIKYKPAIVLVHDFLYQKYRAKERVQWKIIKRDGRGKGGWAYISKFPEVGPADKTFDATIGFRVDGLIEEL